MNQLRKHTDLAFLAAYLCLYALYAWVGYSSPGYDDELFNIRWVEQLGAGVVGFTQSADIHPPGQYAVSWLLFTIFGDWSLVRLLISLLTATSLVYAVVSVRRLYGERPAVLALLLLGLNPAVLMWCTGLRWYALFVPVLLWLCFPSRDERWRYWIKCFGGLWLLAYIGYLALLIAVPVVVLYWTTNPRATREKLRQALVVSTVFGLLYLHQLSLLFSVHLPNGSHHLGSSIPEGVMGFLVTQASNQGVFPLSVAGVLSAIGMAGLFFLLLYRPPSAVMRSSGYFLPYALGVVLLVLSGIAGHFRNFVVLSPLQGLWLATATLEPQRYRWFKVFFVCVLLGNLVGVYNVVTHTDTVKTSWNTPVAELQKLVEEEGATCGDDLLLLTHDPVLAYHFSREGYAVVSGYGAAADVSSLPPTASCVIAVKTYVGTLGDARLDQLYGQLALLDFSSVQQQHLGRDRYYAFKRRLDSRFPEHLVEVEIYRDVKNAYALTAWLPL